MNVELSQIELNLIRRALCADPLVEPAITEEGMDTGGLHRRRVILSLLNKLPPTRDLTYEEYEQSCKNVGVTPLTHYLHRVED